LSKKEKDEIKLAEANEKETVKKKSSSTIPANTKLPKGFRPKDNVTNVKKHFFNSQPGIAGMRG
jgi:hypothetical protein